jgi:hypothetical protein
MNTRRNSSPVSSRTRSRVKSIRRRQAAAAATKIQKVVRGTQSRQKTYKNLYSKSTGLNTQLFRRLNRDARKRLIRALNSRRVLTKPFLDSLYRNK